MSGHFHDTGQALAILAALETGISIFHTSVAGLGGCPYAKGATGNVATEDVLYMLRGLDIDTGVDFDAVVDIGQWMAGHLNRRIQPRRQRHRGQARRMSVNASAPTAEERAALLRDIGPALVGPGLARRVRILSWVILAVLGVQAVTSAIGAPDALEALLAVLAGLCFARCSWPGTCRPRSPPSTSGLRQSWYRRREVAWACASALRAHAVSKRLVIFTHSGRPVIFQGGTRELRAAFVKIARV